MNKYLVTWGSNSNKQLYNPGVVSLMQIANISSGGRNIESVSIGYQHSLAQSSADSNGFKYLVGWGKNTFGEIEINSEYSYKNYDAGINTTYAVDNNGRLHGYGYDLIFSDVSLYTGIILNWPFINSNSIFFPENGGLPQLLSRYPNIFDSVSAGSGYVIALTIDGKITGWGNSGNPVISGNRYTNINSLDFVTGVSAGHTHALALLKNGIITGWGDNSYNQLNFDTGRMSGVKVSTRGNENLFMGLYYPLITNISTGVYNVNHTGWLINYKKTKNITGLIIQRSLDGISWVSDKKTGFNNFNLITGSGYQLNNNDYYVRLIGLNSNLTENTGSYSIFNPQTNKFKTSTNYKLYYEYQPNILTDWKQQLSWVSVPTFFSFPPPTGADNQKLSQILFDENGEKQILQKSFDLYYSSDYGHEWSFKQSALWGDIYVSGYKSSLSPNGNTFNVTFERKNWLYTGSNRDNYYVNMGLLLYDTNINSSPNSSNQFPRLWLGPISYCLDEAQINPYYPSLTDIREWISTDNMGRQPFKFQFKDSHSSNLYTVLVSTSGSGNYRYPKRIPVSPLFQNVFLNSSGRLWLFENWQTGFYSPTQIVYTINNRYQVPFSNDFPDPFFERTATFKNSGYHTGDNIVNTFNWELAKITDNKNVYGIVQNNSLGKNLASISFKSGRFIDTYLTTTLDYPNLFSGNELKIYRNNKNWVDMDISEDGKYQTAIANTGLSGYIYVTQNSGNDWTEIGLYSGNFDKIKISKNGKYQILLINTGNNIKDIWSSDTYGNSWYKYNFYKNWVDINVANNGFQGAITDTELYYNYIIDYNKNYFNINNNDVFDISAGYDSNLILINNIVSGTDYPYLTGYANINSDYGNINVSDLSSVIIEDSWFENCNGIYNYNTIYNEKPTYYSTGTLNGLKVNNIIKWYKNRWNVYYDYAILIYYSHENTFYPWNVTRWSGLTTGATGTFKLFNPNSFLNTGYTGGNFGTIKKYKPLIPPGVVITCDGYVFDT